MDKNFETLNLILDSKVLSRLADEIDELGKNFEKFSGIATIVSNSLKSVDTNAKSVLTNIENRLSKFSAVIDICHQALVETLEYASDGEHMAGLVVQSGLAADKFQGLANAAKKYGGSAEETAKSVETLKKGLADIQKGGDGVGLKDTLAALDINPDKLKSTDDFLQIIAYRMETLKTDTEKMDFGRALGLDDATIKTLSGGLKEYNEELKKSSEYNAFSPEDMARAEELNCALADIGTGFYAIGLNIAQLLLPVITPLFSGIKNIVDFFAKNSDMVKNMLLEMATVCGVILVKALWNVAGAGVAAMAPFLPAILLIGGLIAAFVGLNYIVSEFISWINGKDSIFDKWFKDFETFREGITVAFKRMPSVWLEAILAFCNGVKNAFTAVVGFVSDVISKIFSMLPDWLQKYLVSQSLPIIAARAIAKHYESKKDGSHASGLGYVPYDGYLAELHQGESVLDKSNSIIWRDLQSGKDAIAATANVPLASVPQGAISKAYRNSESTQTFNIGDITVQTAATDAGGIASDLVESIKMAFNGLDTGVRA